MSFFQDETRQDDILQVNLCDPFLVVWTNAKQVESFTTRKSYILSATCPDLVSNDPGVVMTFHGPKPIVGPPKQL
jgi:hypothetical protein